MAPSGVRCPDHGAGGGAQQPFTANTPIKDLAAEALDGIRATIDVEEYSAALARGTSTPFEVAAKALMSRQSVAGAPVAP